MPAVHVVTMGTSTDSNAARRMNAARAAKADEFYTRREDIEQEMTHYREHFRGARVLLNTDDPRRSQFWRYFSDNFDELGLDRVTASYYSETDPVVGAVKTRAGTEELHLTANGDFRSAELERILDDHDIVVTNPPFSLFRSFVTQLQAHDKKFIILGNMNAMKYREIFPIIAAGRMWWGPSIRSGGRPFRVPEGYEARTKASWIDHNGERWIRVSGVRWFTNLDYAGRHDAWLLTSRYEPERYPRFDNFDAIEVSKVAEIPSDYDGHMAVPITYLGRHDPEQFEIIDLLNRYAVLDSQGTNESVRALRSHSCNIGGRARFARIVIRKREAAS